MVARAAVASPRNTWSSARASKHSRAPRASAKQDEIASAVQRENGKASQVGGRVVQDQPSTRGCSSEEAKRPLGKKAELNTGCKEKANVLGRL